MKSLNEVVPQMASHFTPGVCRIEREILPQSNDRLVVHDSQGYDVGKEDNLQLLQKFIKSRTSNPDLPMADRLHCIWYALRQPNQLYCWRFWQGCVSNLHLLAVVYLKRGRKRYWNYLMTWRTMLGPNKLCFRTYSSSCSSTGSSFHQIWSAGQCKSFGSRSVELERRW